MKIATVIEFSCVKLVIDGVNIDQICHVSKILSKRLRTSVQHLRVLLTDVRTRTDEEVIEYWQSVLGPTYQIVVSTGCS